MVFFNPPVTAAAAPTPSAGGTINLSMNGKEWGADIPQEDGWQEYKENDAAEPSGFLLYDDDTTSAYKIELVDGGTARDGQQTGDDTGIVPDAALEQSFAHQASNTYYSFKFTGMDSSMTYQLELIPSYQGTWNWIQYYKIDGVEKNMVSDQNTSSSLTFTGVEPDASDEILIEFKGINGWALVNAIILTEE